MRNFLTEEEWNTFREIYLAEFEHAPRPEAYRNACKKIKAQGGRVPSYKTLIKKMKGSAATPATPATPKTEEPEQNTTTKTTTKKADYQERLEMIVKLYRRRAEKDCDEICDKLLPELEYEK